MILQTIYLLIAVYFAFYTYQWILSVGIGMFNVKRNEKRIRKGSSLTNIEEFVGGDTNKGGNFKYNQKSTQKTKPSFRCSMGLWAKAETESVCKEMLQPLPKQTNSIILIPAYKPSPTLLKVLKSIFEAKPKAEVFVLFQEANPAIVNAAQKYPIYLVEKSFKNSEGNPYHHALRFAVQKIKEFEKRDKTHFSHLILLDKDNIVHPEFFNYLEEGIQQGYTIVQGKRLPHQSNSVAECYDTISEALNDCMLRQARNSTLGYLEVSGSGIAFNLEAFEIAVNNLDARAPGMDKNLMVQLLTQFSYLPMLYQPKAIVYDEKTEELEALQQQRTRWFGNQYFNAFYHSIPLIKAAIKHRRFAPIDYCISLWRPPRSLHLFIIQIFFIVEILGVYPSFPFWSLTNLAFIISNLWFLHRSQLWKEASKILLVLPLLTFNNIKAIFLGSSKKAQGKFIHTKHK